ncbi:MAG TPA: geranylgeranylglyceryl/heptaprenylglyceryl phosphate synthase [Candidatus Poseidoniaceae archaeon]|nr:MAG TPA: geranylgeranylglyceryl/heptaprenylglyceryl phosphate synthase [Candidatus Poseidoniales archaeon]HII45341.1 geranylgeranylglyceryl/heptaprenylglyceryl phosphate synthase [Candidatus Poseidoniaceae archaeon]
MRCRLNQPTIGMRRDEGSVLSYITDTKGRVRHITLIDPDKQSPQTASDRACVAVEAGTSMIFVGGSTDTPDEIVHATCVAIQEGLELRAFAASQSPDGDELRWQIPVVLFPGGSHALSPAADAITFMMLMNSTDRRFLVGEQLRGAPYLDKFGVDALPTGYLVCHPGGKVGEVGSADLLMPNDVELVKAYSLTAVMFGFKLLYLEAGSGADNQVSPDLIKSARTTDGLTLIVGGGIRTAAQAKLAAESGADWVVTGTLTEDATNLNDLKNKIAAICSALSE